MGRSTFEGVVSTFKLGRGDSRSEKQILLHFCLRLFGRPTHVWPYPEFSSVNVGWPSSAIGTRIIPLDILFNCVSPCLMFLRFTVRCAAYAAWATPGLVWTDKTCVKLTCLYQVRVFSKSNKQVKMCICCF